MACLIVFSYNSPFGSLLPSAQYAISTRDVYDFQMRMASDPT